MEIKQFYIYKLKNNSEVVVIQNNLANKMSDFIVVLLYINGNFESVDTIGKDCFMEEIGKLTEEEIGKAKEFYQSVML